MTTLRWSAKRDGIVGESRDHGRLVQGIMVSVAVSTFLWMLIGVGLYHVVVPS
ncbi:hypothetical protein [Marinivivus vitaminiproducens]|uniref:hypothetical protein n=1 Tax=Marinivivus vitaminiproducens TaxID=3035935 RepID=UPI0027A21B42|nr:hypothetical protein P4R82_12220 [Geminicoccaceae bacterium SCSIO 64248]